MHYSYDDIYDYEYDESHDETVEFNTSVHNHNNEHILI